MTKERAAPTDSKSLTPWTATTDPRPRSVPVTVVVLTLNEMANIERCLGTLGWADQIMVVDSGSTDGTVEAARGAGAKVLQHSFEDFADQRNWALRHPEVKNPWVLMVDADNWISDSLAREIRDVVRNPDYDCYLIRLRLIWQGTWIRYAGWYANSWQERLMRKEAGAYRGTHSERFVVSGRVGFLANDIVDEDTKPFERWITKHNHYSSLVAKQRFALRRTPVTQRIEDSFKTNPKRRIPRELLKRLVLPVLPGKSLWVFIYMYLLRGGFRHGKAGFWFCALHAGQQLTIDIKVAELKRSQARDDSS